MLRCEVRSRLKLILSMYDAHRRLPVSVVTMCRRQGWQIIYREDIWPLHGCAIADSRQRSIYVNAHLSHAWQRFVLAHELAHSICGHAGTRWNCDDAALECNESEEHEASLVAALILIPPYAIANNNGNPDHIAAACDVPVEVVEMLLDTIA